MSSLAAQKATIAQLLAHVNSWNLEAIAALFAPGFVRVLQPGRSVESREVNGDELILGLSRLGSTFITPVKYDFRNYVHDGDAHKSSFEFTNAAETRLGPFGLEGVMILEFTEDGTKIFRLVEYVDSKVYMAFREKLAAAMKGGPPN
nr:hypothetical protein B0A51_01372 [Rachicladosporium sp. CCFEE 5018]